MKLNGAQLTIRLLERQGIDLIAGIPGGANLPLYDALGASAQIRHVLARHEQGAGFIAQGIARSTGRTAVCFATSGPGATNLLTAIADAKLDSIPLVAITGQVALPLLGTDAFQEVDTFGLTIPIAKHNWIVRSARELLRVIPEAFRLAASGRPGPVVMDIPKDVQAEAIEIDALPEPGRADAPVRPAPEAVERMAAMIAAARRPAFYVGGGVIGSDGAPEALRRLASRLGIPVVATLMGLGAMPADDPLFLGMLGMHAARHVNMTLEEADLLIAIGARFDDRATGKIAEFCPDAAVIHIDVDAAELGKIRRPTLAIAADAGAALRALEARLDGHPADGNGHRGAPAARRAWLERVAELRRLYPLAMPGADDPTTPYGIIRAVAGLADEDAIVTTDVGQHQMWVAQACPFRRPRSLLTSGGLGTMGFGLPAALGAALAWPDRQVICFSGDGSLLMNIQELAVARQESLNVKVILFNNGSLGLVRQQQRLFYGERYGAIRLGGTDFVRAAEGFGVPALDLGLAADPIASLARVMSRPGPALVNVPIAEDAMVLPMVPPGGANRETIEDETMKKQ
jgi:acetolactate synthase-1/2/3 large subunit